MRLAAAHFAFQSYTISCDISISHAKNCCEDMWHGGKDTELGIKRFQLLLPTLHLKAFESQDP